MFRKTLPFLFGLLLTPMLLEAASPQLNMITPRGGQRGSDVEITFHGARLDDAKQVMFYSPGISVVKLEDAPKANQVKATIKIAPDCRLGEHLFRLRTETGISELRTFLVGPFPTVMEVEPNSEFTTPQAIDLNTTVEGVVQNEDVDYYIFKAKKGQRISAEVQGIRLAQTLFDAYVSIMSEDRFDLAYSDDSSLALQDPIASIIAPKDGNYVVQIRESSYGGNGNCRYRLHIGEFPRPMTTFPLGGTAGQELAVKYLGDPTGEILETIKLPNTTNIAFNAFAKHGGFESPSPNPLRVSPFPNVLEKEPNNSLNASTLYEGDLPVAFNGIISEASDIDCFKFKAKKNQTLQIQVNARSLRSPLDSVLNVYDAKSGRHLISNDDTRGPDSFVRYRIPADGEYIARVRDHLNAGGPGYTYRIEVTFQTPQLTINVPRYNRNVPQDRQSFPVPQGGRYATTMAAVRTAFGGDLQFDAANLPAGIKMTAPVMASNQTVIPVLFEAAPDAALSGSLTTFNAKHVDPAKNIAGTIDQETPLVLANNNTTYYKVHTDRIPVAVTKKLPFQVEIVQPKVPIVRKGSMRLKVVAKRDEGFKAPITLRMLYNPTGIGSSSSVQIPADQSEAYYPINASSSAELRTWPIVVTATATVGNGTIWTSTQMAELEVSDTFVEGKIEMAATERGHPADVYCKFEHKVEFDGAAKIRLIGLPALAKTTEQEITKATEEIAFPVTTEVKSPVGVHKGLFCQLIIQKDGESIVHNIAHGGTFRIDPPPPAPKKPVAPKPAATAAAKPAPKPAAPAAKPARRLTRLERLRQQQAERLKALQADK